MLGTLLYETQPAALPNASQTLCAIGSSAGEHHAKNLKSIRKSGRFEQRVDRWPRVMLFGTPIEEDELTLESHVTVSWRDVNMALHDELSIGWLYDR
jgi:hypothetical protein